MKTECTNKKQTRLEFGRDDENEAKTRRKKNNQLNKYSKQDVTITENKENEEETNSLHSKNRAKRRTYKSELRTKSKTISKDRAAPNSVQTKMSQMH